MRRLLVLIFLAVLLLPNHAGSEELSGKELYESQLNKGIKNSDAYSYILIKKAQKDKAGSNRLLNQAAEFSPDLPAVYFELSKNSLSPSYDGIMNSFNYFVQGINSYLRNFWWSFTISGIFFYSLVFSFILALLLLIIIRLPGDISLISHDIRENYSRILILLGLIPLSIISPLLLLAGILILIGIYMRKRDSIIVYFFLLCLVFSPLLFKAAAFFVSTPSSGSMKSIVQTNESRGNSYAISLLKNNKEYDALFTYALALKREKRYDEAIEVYNELLKIRPSPAVYVNLGNCYVGLYNFNDEMKYNLQEAEKHYLTAISMQPSASAYYNLSQVSREMFDFTKGDEYFKAAVLLNRDALVMYRNIYGRTPGRLVADETIGFYELWNYSIEKIKKVSSFGIIVGPPWLLSVISAVLSALFFMMCRKLKYTAYKCRRCNTVLCGKCEKHLMWGQMCPQCYRSLVKLDELDTKERVARLLRLYDLQKRRRDIMKILSFIIPGSAQIYSGKMLTGFAYMWLFLFFVIAPFMISIIVTDNMLLSHEFFKWAAITLAVVLYLIINFITRQRISKGWL
ncbi:MAG: hypothetical protein A2X59_01870 [Nitrospirae bacterium GWC2_42_7]|nr:MAG: hypothetical protein A2X59_01870 [Nitrospirae bacterium GWC2_42_7]